MYLFLSGGTGTPKLLQGFRKLIDEWKLYIACNTGDDYFWNSLLVCPDLDTVLYLFADKLDVSKFWGRKAETFNTLSELRAMGEDYLNTWFSIGDKDLALHVFRNYLMNRGDSKTDVAIRLAELWGIKAKIFPMSNEMVSSIIYSGKHVYDFQEYFVKMKTNVPVDKVEFKGSKQAHITPLLFRELHRIYKVVIGPSNPVTSIGPFRSVEEIETALKDNKEKIIAVSPLIGGRAFSGPSVSLMKAQGIEPSPLGVAKYYQPIVSTFILDESDRKYKKPIEDLDIEPIFANITMDTEEAKIALAKVVIDSF